MPTSGPGPSGPSSAGGATATPPSVPTGGVATYSTSDWELWWRLHRDELLGLRKSARTASLVSTLGWDEDHDPLRRRGIDPAYLRGTVLPRLRELLDAERNPDVLTSAMIALAKLGSGACREDAALVHAAIVPFLSGRTQEVSETAVLAIGLGAEPAAAGVLSAIAQDSDEGRRLVGGSEVPLRSRAFACYGLGLLARRLGHVDVRRYAAGELRRIHDRDRSSTRDVRVAALSALALLGIEGTPRVRSDGGSGVGGHETELAWLSEIVRDASAHEASRVAAANTIARLASNSSAAGRRAAAKTLCDELARPSARAQLRQGLVQAIGMLSDTGDPKLESRARNELERQLHEGDSFTRGLAAMAIALRVRPGVVLEDRERPSTSLRAECEKAPGTVRPWLVLAAGISAELERRAGHPESDSAPRWAARGLAATRNASEVGTWCLAAGMVRAADAEHALVLISTGGRHVTAQQHAALALGLLQPARCEQRLVSIVRDSLTRPATLLDASIALGLVGSDLANDTLIEVLGRASGLAEQSALAAALSYVGDARALDPLLAYLPKGGRPDRIRAFAAVAIGAIVDESELPWNAELASSACPWLAPPTLYEPTTGTGILDLF